MPTFCLHTLIWPITGVGFFRTARQRSIARQRSTIHRVASLWLVRLNCAFWLLSNLTECLKTLNQGEHPPDSRVWILILYHAPLKVLGDITTPPVGINFIFLRFQEFDYLYVLNFNVWSEFFWPELIKYLTWWSVCGHFWLSESAHNVHLNILTL